MKREDIDWTILRGALIIFLISLLIGISLVVGSWYFKEEMLSNYNKNQWQFQAVSRQYLAVDEEERLIREYFSKFLMLFERGILGREQRLNWIETLSASGDRIELPSLRYAISSLNTYSPDFPINSGNFKLYASNMKLNLNLLHEGDLIRLLSDLDRHALGTYSVSKCQFNRTTEEIQKNATKGNISTECELQWFNIKNPDGSEIDRS